MDLFLSRMPSWERAKWRKIFQRIDAADGLQPQEAIALLDANGQLVEQARDDGEVGRPGNKLLELLRQRDLEGLLVVSRFFGGIKLGPGGVGRRVAADAAPAANPVGNAVQQAGPAIIPVALCAVPPIRAVCNWICTSTRRDA